MCKGCHEAEHFETWETPNPNSRKPMPHINLPEGYPGISAGFTYRPETAKPMRDLAHVLLHEPNSLTPGERELIATFVSSRNDCYFCTTSHGAAAACHLGDASVVEQVKTDFMAAPLSPKLKALLVIAGTVQQDGKLVTKADVEAARAGCDRHRNPRHRPDCRGVLYVQPLRGRPGHMAASQSGDVRANGKAPGGRGLPRAVD
jgi:AhpD family alkylhydroperoxidase